jgi:hypothetical protein
LVALSVVMVLAVASGCFAADKVDIAGKWKCKGTNPNGKEYEGTVEITKDGDTYKVAWTLGGGADNYDGVGILEGDVLAVSFGDGVVVYKIEKDKMSGKWTTPDSKGKVFTETLTK